MRDLLVRWALQTRTGSADKVPVIVSQTAVLARPVEQVTGSRRLAVLRIVAGATAVYMALEWWGYPVAPVELRFSPRFADWPLPVSTGLQTAALTALAVGGVCVAVGWYHRIWGWVAFAGFFYAGWLTTFTGKVNHMHHVGWFLILVAVAPAASAWAVRKERVRGSEPWAITGFCVLLGLTYFSAGLAKVKYAGLGWGAGLVEIIDVTNVQKGLPATPDWLRPFGTLAGTGALLFELLFLPLIVWPRSRRWVWPAGVVFHLGTWWVMGINFATLWPFYAVFLFSGGVDREPTRLQARTTISLVTLVAIVAAVGIGNGWPVASYPGFERVGTSVIVEVDGEPITSTEYARRVGRASAVAHAVNSIRAGKAEAFADWLGVRSVTLDDG